jgi:hypothetical protein
VAVPAARCSVRGSPLRRFSCCCGATCSGVNPTLAIVPRDLIFIDLSNSDQQRRHPHGGRHAARPAPPAPPAAAIGPSAPTAGPAAAARAATSKNSAHRWPSMCERASRRSKSTFEVKPEVSPALPLAPFFAGFTCRTRHGTAAAAVPWGGGRCPAGSAGLGVVAGADRLFVGKLEALRRESLTRKLASEKVDAQTQSAERAREREWRVVAASLSERETERPRERSRVPNPCRS